MTDLRHLHAEQADQLAQALASCPELRATAEHVREFADLMNKHRGDRLADWMQRVQADRPPALHSLVTGLRRDLDAVVARLTMLWNSGPVEGNVNRIINRLRPSRGRCTAGPASRCYARESCSAADRYRDATPQDPRQNRIA
jgi:transposase